MRMSDNPAARPRTTIVDQRATGPEPVLAIPTDAPSLDGRGGDAGALEDNESAEIAFLNPQPTREPIDSARQDNSIILAFWGPDDETGRLVRWRQGRHFNNRRWVTGGCWAPADGMIPLPAAAPTEWLKEAEPPEPEPEAEGAEEEAA